MKHAKHSTKKMLLRNKVIPAFLAAVAIAILTFVLYYFNYDALHGQGASAIIFASFGGSAFILFMMPRVYSAKVSRFVKGYFVGAIIGVLGYYMLYFLPLYFVAGFVVFLLSLLMYMVDAVHPPAVGIALAFVLYRIEIGGALIVVLGVVVLLFLRLVLEKFVYIIEKDVVKEIERV